MSTQCVAEAEEGGAEGTAAAVPSAHVPSEGALLTRVFALAAAARTRGDHPFGALLASADGAVVLKEALNSVNSGRDMTAHAEMALVRALEAEGRLGELRAGVVFASCEPCPMCMGALFWAGARRVVYGLSHGALNARATAPGARRVGFAAWRGLVANIAA